MKQPTVLVVEDDVHSQKILERILTRDRMLRYLNIEVIIANDGDAGLAAFREHRPELVISDLLMPNVDGFKLVELIRAEDHGAKIPILVTSAVFRDSPDLRRLQAKYKVAFYPKPFSPVAMAQKIRQLLRSVIHDSSTDKTTRRVSIDVPSGAKPTVAEQAARTPVQPASPLKPLKEGDLAKTPLARVLLACDEEGWTGTINLLRGKVQKVIYALGGQLIFVQSNLRAETLGQLLVRRNGITPEQDRAVLAEAQKQNIKYGEALVRLKLMTESEVMAELVSQTQFKVENCLRWHEGTWSYTPDPNVGRRVPNCTVDPVNAVFYGLRRSFDVEEALTRLGACENAGDRVVLLPRFERYRQQFVSIYGSAVLNEISIGRSLTDITMRSVQNTVLQIDVLRQCELMEFQPLQAAVSTPQVVANSLVGSLPLENLTLPPVQQDTVDEDIPIMVEMAESRDDVSIQELTAEDLPGAQSSPFDNLPDLEDIQPLTSPPPSGELEIELTGPLPARPAEQKVAEGVLDVGVESDPDPSGLAALEIDVVTAEPLEESEEADDLPDLQIAVALPDEHHGQAPPEQSASAQPATEAPKPDVAEAAEAEVTEAKPEGNDGDRPSWSTEITRRISVAKSLPEESFEVAAEPDRSDAGEEAAIARQMIDAYYLRLHDANHYQVLGVIPNTDQFGVQVAYEIKRKQFSTERHRDIDLGPARAHLDEIIARLDESHAVLSDPGRRAAYDAWLRNTPTSHKEQSNALAGEGIYRRGEALFENEQFESAADAFAEAAALDEQALYLAREALARFLAEGATTEAAIEAMTQIQEVLADDPDEKAAHLAAAAVTRVRGDNEESLQHLQAVLRIDPTDRDAFEAIEAVLLDLNRPQELEIQYRRTIHLLGERDVEFALEVWRRLVLLYRDRLCDLEKATLACDTALRIAPQNNDLRELRRALATVDPTRWPNIVLGYRSLLRSDPRDLEPLHQLYQLHNNAGRVDAAFTAASAALLRGEASTDETAFYKNHYSASAPQIDDVLTFDEKLRHPDDDERLVDLFTILAPALQKTHPLRPADFGLEEVPSKPADAFAEQLNYVCVRLEINPPGVLVRESLPELVQSIGTRPPFLLVSPFAFQTDDEIVYRFLLGRALTPLTPRLIIAAWQNTAVLRDYIKASLALTFPDIDVSDDEGEIARLKSEIESLVNVDALKKSIASSRQWLDQLRLSRWRRGVQYTADRVGLLMCGDLVIAGGILRRISPGSEHELIDFALSESYSQLRDELEVALGSG